MYISILYIYLNRYLCFYLILRLFDFYLFHFWISYISLIHTFCFLFSMKSLFFDAFYLFLFCCSVLLILISIFFCVVTCWFLVFYIFIYSCNYIFVFFSISSRLFCITALSDVVFSRCFPHKLLSLSSYIFVLFVAMFSFAFLLSLVLFASFILDIFIFVCGYRIII